MRYRFIAISLCLFTIICIAPTALAAKPPKDSAKFTQKILPLNCQFQTINDGMNTIVYLTPSLCNHPVVPNPSKKPATSPGQSNSAISTNINTSAGQPVSNSGPIITVPIPNAGQSGKSTGSSTTELNTKAHVFEARGTDVTVSSGDTLHYTPSGDNTSHPHSLTVVDIETASVTILLQPANQLITLAPSHTVMADYNQAGRPTIAVTLKGTLSGDRALLHIRLVTFQHKTNSAPPQSTTSQAQVWVIFGGLTLATVLLRLWQNRFERRL